MNQEYLTIDIICSVCNESFKISADRSETKEPLPTICLKCKAKQINKSNKQESSSVSYQIKDITCSECGETFKERINRRDIGEQLPTICPKCKIRKERKTVKAVCPDCNKVFDFVVYRLLDIEKPLFTLCYECRAKKRAIMEQEEKDKEKAQLQDTRNGWLKYSGIPDKFINKSLSTFEDRGFNSIEILKHCQDYVNDFSMISAKGFKSFILISPNNWGVGKSHLACGIAKGIIEKWLSRNPQSPVYYATEQDMLRRVRTTYNRDTKETEEQVYEHLTNVPLLIIDDLGKEEVSDPRFVQRFWFSVINGRYENELPIVITANLSPDGIAVYLGGSRGNEASFDRLYEMVGGIMWEIQGKSKRREV